MLTGGVLRACSLRLSLLQADLGGTAWVYPDDGRGSLRDLVPDVPLHGVADGCHDGVIPGCQQLYGGSGVPNGRGARICPAWGRDDGSLVEVRGAWLGMLCFHSRRAPWGKAEVGVIRDGRYRTDRPSLCRYLQSAMFRRLMSWGVSRTVMVCAGA